MILNSKRNNGAAVAAIVAIMIVMSFGSLGSLLVKANGASSITNLKALIITCQADFYSKPYSQHIVQNMMRDWGIPFDSLTIGSVTGSTFWDTTGNTNRYQYVVYFGCVGF